MEWKQQTDNGKKEGLNLGKLKFTTNDPAPPFNYMNEAKYKDVPYLKSILLDNEKYNLFERYRALFTLREICTEEAILAICQTLTKENSRKCSSLLKHEVAFVVA
jgi:deoxyhypusine monooxygenase